MHSGLPDSPTFHVEQLINHRGLGMPLSVRAPLLFPTQLKGEIECAARLNQQKLRCRWAQYSRGKLTGETRSAGPRARPLFHVEQSRLIFLRKFPSIRESCRRDCRKLKIYAFCRHADISCIFPTKRYLCSDFGIKIGSCHSQFLSFLTSSRSRPPIQRITSRA